MEGVAEDVMGLPEEVEGAAEDVVGLPEDAMGISQNMKILEDGKTVSSRFNNGTLTVT